MYGQEMLLRGLASFCTGYMQCQLSWLFLERKTNRAKQQEMKGPKWHEVKTGDTNKWVWCLFPDSAVISNCLGWHCRKGLTISLMLLLIYHLTLWSYLGFFRWRLY